MLATIGTIVVLILKIIGIALLCILGLILLIILIVLFVPFRYSAEGSFDENLRIRVKFSWLLHLINGSYTQHDKESDVRVRIALFQIFPKGKSKAKAKPKPASKSKKERPSKSSVESSVKPSVELSVESSVKPSIDSKDETPKKQKQEKKPGKKSENKSSPIEQFKAIWNFLQEDENEGLLRHVLKYIGRLIKWIFPRRAYANIEFGLDDPATTGYITGLTSIVYVKTRGNFQVIPNFHEEVIKGSFKIRGKLYLYQPVYYIIRIIIDKRVRRMLKFLKKRN